MALYQIALLFAALAILFRRIYVGFFQPDVAWVPGPFLCKITDLPSLYAAYWRRHGNWLQELHAQYGDIVRIGPNRFSLADPAVLNVIYDAKNEFQKSEKMAVMHGVVNGKIVPGMVSATDKALHQSIRKPVAGLYAMSNVMSYEAYVDETLKTLIRRLSEEFVDNKQVCDFSDWAQYWSTDTVTNLTTGKPMGFLAKGADVDGMLNQIHAIQRYRSLVIHAPWIDWILVKNPIRRYFSSTPLRMMQRARGIVMARMKSKADQGPPGKRDILGQLLEVHEQKPQQVPARRIMAYVGINLQAGSDTTAIHMRSIVYHVLRSKNLEIAKKLQKELDAATDSYPITYQEALQLPYLTAVIREAQRMFHVGAGIIERVVPTGGLELPNGKILPKGAGVGLSGVIVQFNKSVYGDDADSYNPERWLRGEKESEEDFATRLRAMNNTDMTWGRGSRTCLGKNIAMVEMYKCTAALFGLFNMELVDPEREWHVEENFFRVQHDININIAWRPGKSMESISKEAEYSEKAAPESSAIAGN